jgi:CDP-diacylglycerol---serine O-phosphatidyltransferase
VLPTLFTAGNIFLGYLAILRTIQGALIYSTNQAQAAQDFKFAAVCIGLAVVLDGLDGRIARMTNTTSDFGRELDSLADIISFGIAPAILAYVWGVQFVTGVPSFIPADQLQRAGKFLAFLFLVCGAMRLARFNVQKNPQPRNPGIAHRKYFVGLPIPAAAGMVAAVVYAFDSYPVTEFIPGVAWLFLLACLSLLMVSAWRYWSFKELNPLRPGSPMMLVVMGCVIFAIWNWSEPVLLIMACVYVASGILTRIGGIIRRNFRTTPKPRPETQIG